MAAGNVINSTKLPLQTWFLARYLISQVKKGKSSLARMRQLGTSCRTAWLVHHKDMAAMAQCEAQQPLVGDVQLDDTYLGGERSCVGGRWLPNKVPLVAAVRNNERGYPIWSKLRAIKTF